MSFVSFFIIGTRSHIKIRKVISFSIPQIYHKVFSLILIFCGFSEVKLIWRSTKHVTGIWLLIMYNIFAKIKYITLFSWTLTWTLFLAQTFRFSHAFIPFHYFGQNLWISRISIRVDTNLIWSHFGGISNDSHIEYWGYF